MKEKKKFSIVRILTATLIAASVLTAIFYWYDYSSAKKGQRITLSANTGLLYPASKLNEQHLYLQEAIKYGVVYYNAFFKNRPGLTIKRLSVNDNLLDLEIQEGVQSFTINKNLDENPIDEVLSDIFRSFVQKTPDPQDAVDIETIKKIDAYLLALDEFSYIRALKIIEQKINASKYPPQILLYKAAQAYLHIVLINRETSFASFYDDLKSRAYALATLASLSDNNIGKESLYTKILLSYVSGDKKKAYELSLLPEGQSDERCRVYSFLKNPLDFKVNDDHSFFMQWKLEYMGSRRESEKRQILEKLYQEDPYNLFALEQLGALSVEEGRIYLPLLIFKTVQKHTEFINAEYPEMAGKLKGSTVERIFEVGKKYLFLFRNAHSLKGEDYKVPAANVIKNIHKALFKGKNYPVELSPEIFSENDERLLYYHNLLSALGQWHYLLTDTWCVRDYAMDASKQLNEIFENDPYIKYLYGKAFLGFDRRQDAANIFRDIVQKTGDRYLILTILRNRTFQWQYINPDKNLIDKMHMQFPHNGSLSNAFADITDLDNDQQIRFLNIGLKRDPWNVRAAHKLAWATNDLEIMKRFLKEKPQSALGYYYAGFMAYKRLADAPLAVNYLKQALNIEPSMFSAICELGAILENEDRTDEALKVYKEYLRIDSDSLSAIEIETRIGLILIKQNKNNEAVSLFSDIAQSYKASAMAGAVKAYFAAGDLKTAEMWAKRLYERYQDLYSIDALCQFYYKTGEADKLRQVLKEYQSKFQHYSRTISIAWKARLDRKDLFGRNIGCMVRYIHIGSSAADAGLEGGDIIMSYGKKQLNSCTDLFRNSFPPDKVETINVFRKDHNVLLQIKGEPNSNFEY